LTYNGKDMIPKVVANLKNASQDEHIAASGNGKQYYINTLNNGAVTNMTDDSYLELLSTVDMKRAEPNR